MSNTGPHLSFVIQTLSQFIQILELHNFRLYNTLLDTLKGPLVKGFSLRHLMNSTLKPPQIQIGQYVIHLRDLLQDIVLLGSSPVCWKRKKQSIVTKSSIEAEYRVMSLTASEVTWLVRLLEEHEATSLTPITLYCDN